MIYNWDEEHVELFGTELTEEEKIKKEQEQKEFLKRIEIEQKNKKRLINLVESFGWELLESSYSYIRVSVDKEYKVPSMDIDAEISDEKYKKTARELTEINNQLQNSIIDRKVHYICKDGLLQRWMLGFRVVEDFTYKDKYFYSLRKEWFCEDCRVIDNFEKLTHLKDEKPLLYDYLEKHRKCFWQMRYFTAKQKRKMDYSTLKQYERITEGIEKVLTSLGA